MRLALLSDIHGNIAGLDAALNYLHKLGGFDVLYALGDIAGAVGTKEVLDALVENHAHLIRGNGEEL